MRLFLAKCNYFRDTANKYSIIFLLLHKLWCCHAPVDMLFSGRAGLYPVTLLCYIQIIDIGGVVKYRENPYFFEANF